MKRSTTKTAFDGTLLCRVLHQNFSPKGGLEGLIVESDGKTVQVVCPPHLREELSRFAGEGTIVTLQVEKAEPSDKGEPEHPVYDLIELPESDARAADISGTVTRFNYAKHGEANGVLLDSGDFVHLKPHGMKQFRLKVGDRVNATGEVRPMERGGRVVEAITVNGKTVVHKPKKH